ncbi:hypothetical protein GUJ93_ZPchr0005g16068 [Zizania palustris]|uniref:Uncharacterized protein n=1 Tax=Zizania palustris TaxID=103762 RepID=A0A8J5SCS7_ZIZPA|nr:hypothetical protein GUJ93_ZPchr0005g16068 [Zizania palustris]
MARIRSPRNNTYPKTRNVIPLPTPSGAARQRLLLLAVAALLAIVSASDPERLLALLVVRPQAAPDLGARRPRAPHARASSSSPSPPSSPSCLPPTPSASSPSSSPQISSSPAEAQGFTDSTGFATAKR